MLLTVEPFLRPYRMEMQKLVLFYFEDRVSCSPICGFLYLDSDPPAFTLPTLKFQVCTTIPSFLTVGLKPLLLGMVPQAFNSSTAKGTSYAGSPGTVV